MNFSSYHSITKIVSKVFPVNLTLFCYFFSPSCSTKTTSPLISSPCHSPVSSGESLANSVPGSPSVHDREDSSQQASRKDGTRIPEERGLQMPDRTSMNNQDSSHIAAADVTGRAVEDFSISAFLKYHNMAHFADQFVGYTLEQVRLDKFFFTIKTRL